MYDVCRKQIFAVWIDRFLICFKKCNKIWDWKREHEKEVET